MLKYAKNYSNSSRRFKDDGNQTKCPHTLVKFGPPDVRAGGNIFFRRTVPDSLIFMTWLANPAIVAAPSLQHRRR